jgi:starch synthase
MPISFEWSKFFKKRLKILFVGAEAAPFAKAGGLGEVLFSLPLALMKANQDVRVFIPRYGTIDTQKYQLETEYEGLKVPTDQKGKDEYLICNVRKFKKEDVPITYFLENAEYYEKRANIYGYADDHIRWALLCRGLIEFLKKSKWVPEIIVCSDWQTGLIPNYLKTVYRNDPFFENIKTVFIIHNLSYQGMCDFRFVPETEKDNGREPIPSFFDQRLAKLNWMLRGIIYSDAIVTVSPTYAKEILTPEYGQGLEKVLNEKKVKLYGILNGINYQKYNPQKDPHLPFNYNKSSIEKKAKNKIPLQKRFALKEDKEIFLIGMPARFTEQKGFDLIEKIIEKLLKFLPLQLIFVGDGEGRYKEMLKKAKENFPEKLGFLFEFEKNLPSLLYAGCDAILIPSKFEPCGITQMEAMRYGAIPIARKTGGLADTIKNFDPKTEEGTGFLFKAYEPYALFATICKAQTIFQIKRIWQKIVKLAMEQDFSWDNSAKEYLNLFIQLTYK